LLEEIKMDLLGKIIRARARVRVNETYNNKELVLYKIDVDPNPENSEIKQAETKPVAPVVKPTSSPAPEESKSVKAEKVDTSTVSEELFDEDDEELLSIDDLEEEI
jgi:hypothetical protein